MEPAATRPQKPRLHIVFVAPLFPPMPGGGATQPFYLVRALGTLPGLRVHVVAPEPSLPKGDKHWFDPRRVSVHRVEPKIDPGKVPFAQFLERALRVYDRIKSREGFSKYDTVVAHGQHWAGVFVAMHLKQRFGVPLVATLHKTPIGGALGEIAKDTDPTYCHWTWLATWPIDAFMAGSTFFESELRRLMPKARIEFVPHGVPARWLSDRATGALRRTARAKLGIPDNADVVLCPVRWDPRKRVPDFLAAAGLASRELQPRDVRFLVTADVHGPERRKLNELSTQAGLAEKLIVQSLSFEDVPSVMAAASLVAVPTDREGLGISVLEALALRKPVVATDVEGIRDVVSHEVNGYLYAAGDNTQLASLITRIIRNRAGTLPLVDAAYENVTRNFNDVRMAALHEKVYRSLTAP